MGEFVYLGSDNRCRRERSDQSRSPESPPRSLDRGNQGWFALKYRAPQDKDEPGRAWKSLEEWERAWKILGECGRVEKSLGEPGSTRNSR